MERTSRDTEYIALSLSVVSQGFQSGRFAIRLEVAKRGHLLISRSKMQRLCKLEVSDARQPYQFQSSSIGKDVNDVVPE